MGMRGTGEASWPTSGPPVLVHYLITRRETKGLEVPHVLMGCGEEVLPVFSSEEAAREFLSLSSLGKGWYVRDFSGGELVSVIFAFYTGMKGILLDPQPAALSGNVMVSLVGRHAFVSSLLEPRLYHSAVGARS